MIKTISLSHFQHTLSTKSSTTRISSSIGKGHWNDSKNQQQYFDFLSKELGIQKLEDWYRIDPSQLIEKGGSSMLKEYFGGSLPKALKLIYPEFEWEENRFEYVNLKRFSSGYWDFFENHKLFMDNVALQLGIKSMEDWYSVRIAQIKSKGGSGLLSRA